MYSLEIDVKLVEKLKKLEKKDRKRLETINKKVGQIRENPYHFKPLRAPMQHMRRVHIDTSFVLIYSVDESRRVVILQDYDHHDNIYL